jgi:poly-gamma-glutamate system protein
MCQTANDVGHWWGVDTIMMYRPSLKSTWTLLILAVAAYSLYMWAEHSHVEYKQSNYNEKIAAAEHMKRSMEILREAQAPSAAWVDEVNDPGMTLLIGQKHTMITSVEGNHQAKLSTINPNMAAMMVQILSEAGLRKNEKLAVCVSGSFPGLNMALYSACKVLDIEPVVITSVSSSWYGANDPSFTWLDMEKVLFDAGHISFRSIAASIGGADDRGRSLPPEGRALIRKAIERNGVKYINAKEVASAVVARTRMFLSETRDTPAGYGAYVNIGGGVASLGHPENGSLIPLGFISHLKKLNYPAQGVIHYFADSGIPVINFKYRSRKFKELLASYGLPLRPARIPDIGAGKIFMTEHYDLRIVVIAISLLAIIILFVIRFDLKLQQLKGREGIPPDEML